ncbi:pyrroline-5-carboxylate reductase [Roseicitreum antarcticum]|uniref:Pyrroline-5-carboxylate reductase n=2 Tax=Roseicitreum antarcticum TaxID=564137 RepID=A0A1H2TMA4_9RHOB|nr:pyrroline-5-carboxylate reductase [Roseicitreum antarcticum]
MIGLGTIATAVVEGIAGDGHDIAVSRRNAQNAARLAGKFENVSIADNQDIVDASDLVFLGTTGRLAPEVLAPLTFRDGQQVIALMADLDFAAVAALVAPAQLAARMIPFPSIASGGSPVLVYGERIAIDTLIGPRNTIIMMDSEAELASYLCAQAVLSPVVSMVDEAAGWLAGRTEDPDKAEVFLRTLVGASLLGSSCAPLLQALNTPGGFNQQLRQHMLDAGLREHLSGGLNNLRD